MERQTGEYIEIDLLRLLGALWRHAVVIVLAGALCGGAGFGLAYWVIPPKYQASVLMYVNNSSISVGALPSACRTCRPPKRWWTPTSPSWRPG